MERIPSKSKPEVATVKEGKTHFILLEDGAGDRSILSVTQSITDHMRQLIDYQSKSDEVNTVLQTAFHRLLSQFGDRIERVGDRPKFHDGELVISVVPKGRVFDQDLSLGLNELAWELEDQLCEATGTDKPYIMLGFRQEFPRTDEQDH